MNNQPFQEKFSKLFETPVGTFIDHHLKSI